MADEVAATLIRDDCRGRPMESRQCPVAVYLNKRGFEGCDVIRDELWLPDGTTLELPKPVNDFIVRFDDYGDAYPELVLEESA